MKKLILFAGFMAAITHPALAIDYTVTGSNSSTNGDLNPNTIGPATGDTLTVENGAIISVGSIRGINFSNDPQSTIINNGQINTLNNSAIVNSYSDDVVITNNGEINASGGYGIRTVNSARTVITNNGQITASANGIFIENFLSVPDGVTVINNGHIQVTGSGNGISDDFSTANTTVINNGTIRVNNVNSVGVLTVTNSTVINSGLIFGASAAGTAIWLTSSSGTLTLSAGSRIQGRIRMPTSTTNTNTVTLDHNGQDIAWRWTIEGFTPAPSGTDTLVVNGAPYVLETTGTTTTVTVADLSREATAGAALADLSGAIRGAVSGRIAQAWALKDAGINSGAAMLDEQGEELGWNAWAKAFGGYQGRGAQGLSGRTDHRYGGVVVGADTAPTGNALFGAFGGYAYSSLAFEDLSLNNSGADNIETHSLFAGVFGRIESAFGQNGGGLFADGTLTLGYADGDPGTRLQANNRVTGGIEEITGGDASGVYADTSITFGANVPVGASGAMLIPSATLAYATQWRKGYTENNAAIGGMDVDGHQVSVLSGRLQLAAQMSGTTASGLLWTAAVRGGVNAQQDMSEDVSFTMLSTEFDTQTHEDDLNIGGLVGANLTFAHSDILAFTLDSEMTLAGPASDQVGGTLNAGVRARF